MKRFLIICIALLFPEINYGQKCEEVTDPITGQKSVKFEYDYTYQKIPFKVYSFKYEVNQSIATLTKEFYYGSIITKTLPSGTEVFLKLENGEIITLKTNKEILPRQSTEWGSLKTSYIYSFSLSKEQLIKLAASPIKLIRIPKVSEEGFIDFDDKNEIVKKDRKPLMKGAGCLITYL